MYCLQDLAGSRKSTSHVATIAQAHDAEVVALIHQHSRLPVLRDENASSLRPICGSSKVGGMLDRRKREAGGNNVRHLRRTHPLGHGGAAGGPRQRQIRPLEPAGASFQHREEQLLNSLPLGRGEQRFQGKSLEVSPQAYHCRSSYRPRRIYDLLTDTVPSEGLDGMGFGSKIRVQSGQNRVKNVVENLVAVGVAGHNTSVRFASGQCL
mmetsp:Transcript_102139/g.234022  ORF Transcript_102139/g.234022 Transcript_102139/m.234022 type:complete len:209 (-) Transcript_102139:677-1303(-)